MKEIPKFCINCVHHVAPNACHHPDNMDYNLVTGQGVSRLDCGALREAKGFGCGEDALWFEPKMTREPETFEQLASQTFNERPPQQPQPRRQQYAVNPDQFAPFPDEGDGPPRGQPQPRSIIPW